MNVSEQIIEVINALCEKLGVAIDWTSTNVLPYIEQLCTKLISFEIYTSIFWIAVSIVVCAICWIVFGATYKIAKKWDWSDCCFVTPINIAAGAVGAILTFIAIIVIGCQAFDIIEAVTFPEKTIYDYICYQISMMNS
jgi:hypothetical protein